MTQTACRYDFEVLLPCPPSIERINAAVITSSNFPYPWPTPHMAKTPPENDAHIVTENSLRNTTIIIPMTSTTTIMLPTTIRLLRDDSLMPVLEMA
jgi:hypothetical protein